MNGCLTLFDTLAQRAGETPDHEAVVSDDTCLTYAELYGAARAVAGSLEAAGVGAGDMVAVETRDPVEHIIGCIGVMAAAAVAVPLPSDAEEACRVVLADCRPRLVLTTGDETVGEYVGATPATRVREAASGPVPGGLPVVTDPERLAMLYYTSGTTSGIRKGVMQSHRQLHASAAFIIDVMRLDVSAREFIASPADNAYWFGRVRTLLRVGATAIVSRGSLNPLKILSAIRRQRCNGLSGDVSVFMMLLGSMERHLRGLAPQLRWIKMASQVMPLDAKRRMQELFPNSRIILGYGLTEAMRCTLLVFNDYPNKLASVGRPYGDVRVRIIDKCGKELPVGQDGQILVAGAHIASGYLNKPQLWAERFRGGWYATGDIGHLDEDGFLYFKGRLDEAVNVGGRTISPLEVEELLRPLLRGVPFGVCGIPDPGGILGDTLALCVEGVGPGMQHWREFRVLLFERMPPYFVPASAFAVPELPMTANGKLQRARLRELIETGQAAPL